MTRVVRLLVVLAVAAALRVEVAQSRSGEGWQLVVEEHLARYPAMGAEDLYKLAHQATFGPAHLITDEAAAKNYLVSELGGVAADDSEPLVETLAADPPLVRVNLRPFKARRGDPARLLAALLTTANTVKGDPTTMRRAVEQARSAGSTTSEPSATSTTTTTPPRSSVSTVPGAPSLPNPGGGGAPRTPPRERGPHRRHVHRSVRQLRREFARPHLDTVCLHRFPTHGGVRGHLGERSRRRPLRFADAHGQPAGREAARNGERPRARAHGIEAAADRGGRHDTDRCDATSHHRPTGRRRDTPQWHDRS